MLTGPPYGPCSKRGSAAKFAGATNAGGVVFGEFATEPARRRPA
jgi:hypothetical protein